MAAVLICFLAVICSLLQQGEVIHSEHIPGRPVDVVYERVNRVGRAGVAVLDTRASHSIATTGSAITCYQCNSHNDSRCLLTKLPDSLRLPCGSKDTMCRKISQVVEFEMNGMPPDSRVIRGCGWDDSSYKGRCYQRSGFGGRQEVCSCLEDGCNSGSIFVAATGLMLLTFALLRF